MNQSICNICGANYENRNGRWKCPACGAFKPEELTNEELTLLYIADQKRRLADFDEAERAYTDIIEKYPQNPYGYWGRLLSKHGIKYESDYDGRMIPTCCAPTIESLFTDSDCLRAIDLADYDTKQYFKAQAEHIERIRDMWITKASKEKPYDIFICYKDSDLGNGIDRTPDSVEAQELYIHLTGQGYRVFFSRESLRDKVGEKYEPYIFNALSTAKVMIVYGKSANYITSTWLKNEWTRYQKMIQRGAKKPNSLIVVCDGFSPSELPTSLSNMQCLDAQRKTYFQDLDATIKAVIKSDDPHKETTPKKATRKTGAITCPDCGGDFSTQDLLDGDSVVTCLSCGKNFFTSEIMAQHKVKPKKMQKTLSESEKKAAEERANKFKKGVFSKVILCFMVIFAALSVACFTNDGILAGIIALCSSILFLLAFLLGIQVLKPGNLNLHIVAAVLAFLLIIPYCIVGSNINFGDDTDYNSTFEWQTNGLFALLPEPETNNGKITLETEKQIQFELYNIASAEFDKYVQECKEYGFTVDVTKNSDVFYAKTTEGYNLAFFYYDDKEVLKISLDSYSVDTSSPSQSGVSNSNTNQDGDSSQSGSQSTQIDFSSFVTGYKKADFSKYNSPASENGLGGDKIYLECTLDSTEVLEADGTKTILSYVTDDSGNRWLILMHCIPLVDEDYYDSVIGKNIVLKGVYDGYSTKWEVPAIILDELLIKESGTTMVGMQKILEDDTSDNSNQSNENNATVQGEKTPDSARTFTVDSNIQLFVNEYRFQGRTGSYYSFFEIKNNSSMNLRLSMNVKFYDGTTIVGTEEETAYSFESGRTILLYVSNDTNYTSTELEFSAKKEESYQPILSELDFEISHGGTKEIVTITNNTTKTAVAMECVILFFNNGKVVAFDTEYFMDDDGYILPGKSVTKEMYTSTTYASYEAYYMGRGEIN